MKNGHFLLIVLVLAIACNRSEPLIVYDESETAEQAGGEENQDTEKYKKLIADLPFSFDSIPYFYFPIGETNESFRMNVGSFMSSKSSKSYSLGYIRGQNVECNLDNILIRPKDEASYKLLTQSELKIKNLNYLYRIDTIHGVERFIYTIIDSDTNKDSEINADDLASLYSSKPNGEDFRRISPKNQQLIDWETADVQGVLFYRTMEDIDRNGKFDDNDRINLYEYNLIEEDTSKLIFNEKIYKEMK